ncbi:YdeI/OmpD-associated family protein [Miltoncostaea marina]|uniref:YdeI/OmpD-associated family protein n=1 Tax=Miltoncostaea marina TaxID=2843215 RepID=UPI001C3E2393|nr:YdeI/OmpD-associated family protein [Miltoncostaea marina]
MRVAGGPLRSRPGAIRDELRAEGGAGHAADAGADRPGRARPLASPPVEPIFFRTAAELRDWFDEHHATAGELWLGIWKRGAGETGVTWREAVDEALCVGWIDSVVRRIDDRRHMQRFTPRRPRSRWSDVNVARVEELIRAGRMRPAGLAAFAARSPERTGTYTHEQAGELELPPEARARLEAGPGAREFFDAQTRTYRRQTIWWVTSAKREETRERRLARLIEASAAGRTLRQFTPLPRGRPAP